jgi:mycofactocin system glycosyltransferase
MELFGFSPVKNTFLRAVPEGFFLLSRTPIKIIKINESLYNILKFINEGGRLQDFLKQNPSIDSEKTLKVLLTLAAGGYLKLDRSAPLKEYPRVSVIIPVHNRLEDLLECLQSLEKLNYPQDRRDIIVIDDCSEREVARFVTVDRATVLRNNEPKGPAACRNTGADNAGGDILAFLDADCIAGGGWLYEPIPFLQEAGAGAAGGFIDGYYQDSFLDRYEKVSSSLNMGKHLIIEAKTESGFYVPTANLVVTRQAFKAAGGFRESMEVGEDVDFCWRLRELGFTLVYTPNGTVAHKHRNRLFSMLGRRAKYGTSESMLYQTHRDKKKGMAISALSCLSFLALAAAILILNPYPLGLIPVLFGIDAWRKSAVLKVFKKEIRLSDIISSTLRSHLSFYYYACFHLVRYYLVLFIGLGFLWYPIWIFGGVGIILSSITDFYVKKPRLLYPVFLCFYLLEHLVYQLGVFWGCLKTGYFGSYLISFKKA